MEEQETLLEGSPVDIDIIVEDVDEETDQQPQTPAIINAELEVLLLQELYDSVHQGNNTRLEEILGECESLEFINNQNNAGLTLLHFACDKSDPDTVRILIGAGADPNIVDGSGRTPLHWTLEGRCHCQFCSQNNAKCIELLRQNGANLDVEDHDGETPLHYAAKNMLPKCAVYLLDNGAKITSISSRAPNVGYLMVQKIPASVARILDRGIIFDETDNSKLKLDFGLILETSKTFQADDAEEICPESDEVMPKESRLLAQMLRAHRSGRDILLTHPLVEAFLHLKWLCVRKWFWMVRFAYQLLISIYSVFVFDAFVWNCPYDYARTNSKDTTIVPDSELKDDLNCGTTPRLILMAVFIITSITCMMLNEVFEYTNDRVMYMSTNLNFGWWALILSMIVTVIPAFGIKPMIWQYPLAAFSLFYAWAMNLTQIGRIPYFGDFIEMLGKVLKDFGIFVLTYSSLMIAFTLGFCVMFPQNQFFGNLALGYVKTLLMMIGEPDYEQLFPEDKEMDLSYSIPAHIIFVGFVFVITIVLMNLLLGLAVSDIQELRKHSALTRATRQIKQIALLESFIHSKWLPRCISTTAVQNSSIRSLIGKSGYLCFAPMDPDDNQLPEDLKHKFVPYLTMSPCLIRPSKKYKFFDSESVRGNRLHYSKVEMYKNRPKEFRQMFLLKSLVESVEELKIEMKKITQKLNHEV